MPKKRSIKRVVRKPVMLIHVIHGSKKHDINIPEDENWTLLQLKEFLHSVVNVSPDHQRLVFKGRTLSGDTSHLSALNIKSGDKIMVLSGLKPVEVDHNLENLIRVETHIVQGMGEKLKELDSTLDGIEKGFLNAELVKEAVTSMDKQLKLFNEDCMKTLEHLDSIVLGENTVGNARIKRKTLVHIVQEMLKKRDGLAERLANYISDRNG